MTIKELITHAQTDVANTLNLYFDQSLNTDETIKAATHYSLMNGGKRLRPFFGLRNG